jgi:hypothetical protein
VITPNRGLLAPSVRVTLDEFAKTDIDPCAEEFRKPLQQDAKSLAQALGPGGEPVLLGSVATPKYASSALSPFVIGPPSHPAGGVQRTGSHSASLFSSACYDTISALGLQEPLRPMHWIFGLTLDA